MTNIVTGWLRFNHYSAITTVAEDKNKCLSQFIRGKNVCNIKSGALQLQQNSKPFVCYKMS